MNFTYTQTCRTPFGSLQDGGKVFTGAADIATDEVLASGNVVAGTINVAFPQSGFQCMALLATQPVQVQDIDIGAFNVTLSANVLSLVTNVTAGTAQIRLDSNNVSAGAIKIRVLYDPTP